VYASAVEKEIGESLKNRLVPPWGLKYPTESVGVSSGSWTMNYAPAFLITNSATGRVLAVEVKSSLSLSLPNILKLQHIQTALKQVGVDFLLVVHGGSFEEPGPNSRLSEYGVHAVDVSGDVDAAGEIKKWLRT
jgi:hypothetical protein